MYALLISILFVFSRTFVAYSFLSEKGRERKRKEEKGREGEFCGKKQNSSGLFEVHSYRILLFTIKRYGTWSKERKKNDTTKAIRLYVISIDLS